MTMAQAILVACIAGLAAALLSGVLTPASAPVMLLTVLAPAPLLIAGFGWHPLVAALGALFAAILADLVVGAPVGLMLAAMIGLPAYGIAALAERAFLPLSGRPDRDGVELGRIALTLILYVALATVIAAMVFQPDYAQLQAQLRRALDAAFARLGPTAPPGADFGGLLDLMARIMLPLSALVSIVTQVISGTLAIQIADRAGRVPYPRPDFRRFRLPGGALILLGVAILFAMMPGYPGLLGEITAMGLAFALVLQGLAVIHVRTLGMAGRGMILTAVWAALIVFGFPALLMLALGMADHLADFRRGRI